MPSEIGVAYVSILPSAAGFKAKLQREIGGDLARAGREGGQEYGKGFAKEAVNEAGDKRVSSGIGDKLKIGLAAAGAAGGVALAAGVGEALSRSQLDAKLAAQLGGGAKTRRATKVASDLFRGAWGDSVEDVNTAVASVVTNIGGMRHATQRELKGVTASVLDIASAFDQDSTAITRAADQLVRTDLAKGPREALDIITRGFQSGANEADDLLDTYAEYGTQFRKLGLDGAEATGLLTQGLRAGARDADVVADAFKEFSIRAVDGSKLTRQSFDALGLSAKEMEERIGAGGKTAADATAEVLDKLRRVKDPAQAAQIAVGLFGTQSEDLGEALYALNPRNAVDTLGKVEGAAKRMGNTLNDNASVRVTEFKRTLQSDFVEFLGNDVIPKAESLYNWFSDLPRPIRKTTEVLGTLGAVGAGGTFLGAKFIGAIGTARTALGGLGSSGVATTSKLGRMSSFVGRAGPWGLAIGAGIGALALFGEAMNDTQVDVEGMTTALQADNGALGENTRRTVANALEKEGALEAARKYGISLDTLVSAALGEKQALREVNSVLNRQTREVRGLSAMSGRASDSTTVLEEDAYKLKRQLGSVSEQTRDNVRSYKRVESAVGDVGKETDRTTGKESAHQRQLKKVADQLGFNQRETRLLIRDYKDVPGKVDTEAIFRTAEAAQARDDFLRTTKGKFADLGDKTYAIMVNGQSGHGRLPEFDVGGWTGPGAKMQPAGLVHADEFVTKKDSRKKMESRFPGYLDYINRHGTLPGYAEGGRVNTKVEADFSALRKVVRELVKSLRSAGGSVPATLAWARKQVGDQYLMGGTGPNVWDCSGFMSGIANHLMGRNPYHNRLFATSSFPTSMFARGPGVFSIGSTRDAGNGIGHMAGTLGNVNVESSGGVGVRVGGGARGATDPLFGGNIWHLKPGLIKRVVRGGGRGDPPGGDQGALNRFEKYIIAHESLHAGGRFANNPSSSAFGLGQLISANRMKYAGRLGLSVARESGDTGTTDRAAQIAMMRMYIKDRYGSSRAAYRYHLSHGVYDTSTNEKPGILKPGFTLAHNGTGRDEYITKEDPRERSNRRGIVGRLVFDRDSQGELHAWVEEIADARITRDGLHG